MYNSPAMEDKNDKNSDAEVVIEEEIVTEEAELEGAAEGDKYTQKLKKLRKKLEESEEAKRGFHEELQRTKADFLNSKRRLEEQSEKDRERANDKIITELLSLADTFDTAKSDAESWEAVDEKWRQGIEAIHSKLVSILANHNVEELVPLGEQFNPEEHEAVSNAIVEDKKQVDTVIEVVQKGYRKNNTIIRPARVIVGTK